MDIVDRLYEQLRRALERVAPGPSGHDPTIGEIYQHLVPYRAMRRELGVWELAEYEHALLRLLAGEGDHLDIPPEIRDELRRELASPSPILGIYRDYAAVRVRITNAPTGPTDDPSPPPLPAPAPTRAPLGATECRACAAALPETPGLRYCPACGADQRDPRCRHCDAPLREEWNFCIRCGTPRDPFPSPRSRRG